MAFEQWFAFAIASAVLLAIPGPTILLVISYALGHGRKAASATVGGVALGDFTAMTASMLGLGALLATSATLFTALKWIGAAYLIYLGLKLWRAPVSASGTGAGADALPKERPLRIFLHTYVVTALNPKSIIFFVAFLPQFISHDAPAGPQLLLLGATFCLLSAVNVSLFSYLAGTAGSRIQNPRFMRRLKVTGGGVMVGAGLLTAAARQ